MTELEEYKQRLKKKIEERKEFDYLEDGYKYYFPTPHTGGLSAHALRTIADLLDEANASWDQQIKEYFDNEVNNSGK